MLCPPPVYLLCVRVPSPTFNWCAQEEPCLHGHHLVQNPLHTAINLIEPWLVGRPGHNRQAAEQLLHRLPCNLLCLVVHGVRHGGGQDLPWCDVSCEKHCSLAVRAPATSLTTAATTATAIARCAAERVLLTPLLLAWQGSPCDGAISISVSQSVGAILDCVHKTSPAVIIGLLDIQHVPALQHHAGPLQAPVYGDVVRRQVV